MKNWLVALSAAFTSPTSIDVGGTAYTATNIMIATGSSVTPLPGVEIDHLPLAGFA